MLRYQSHKIVEAADLIEIRAALEEDGTKCFDLLLEGEDGPLRISEETGKRIMEMCTGGSKPPVMKPGKLVKYEDDYLSWSPMATFEAGYDLAQPSSGKSSIAGYRELDETEIELINRIKQIGHSLEAAIFDVNKHTSQGELAPEPGSMAMQAARDEETIADEIARQDSYRWASIAKTHLQQGLMALTRAVAKPKFF